MADLGGADMRVLVCGGRDYDDIDHIWNTLYELEALYGRFDVVIHGCATGTDTQAMLWAQSSGRKHAPFQADWNKHGRAAGPIRNQRMIDEGKPDQVIAFPGGRGTLDMIRRAHKAGLPVAKIRPRVELGSGRNLADATPNLKSPKEV
jgi:hypothetical protein